MLEESVSRSEFEAATRGSRLIEAATDLSSREEAAAKELRAAASVNTELSAELSRLREKLAAATRLRTLAQTDASASLAIAADTEARATARLASLEAQIAGLQSALRASQGQVEELASLEAVQRASLTAVSAEIDFGRRDRLEASGALSKAVNDARMASVQHATQVTGLLESLRALDQQATRAQSLLATVSEQRRVLETENAELRAESDNAMRRSLAQ